MANLYSLNKQEGETHFNLKTLVTHRQQYEEKKVCRLSTSEAQRKWPQQWLWGEVTLLHVYLPDTLAINSNVANPKLIKAWTKVWVLAWINNMHTVTSAFAVWRKELGKWSNKYFWKSSNEAKATCILIYAYFSTSYFPEEASEATNHLASEV